MLRPPTRSHLFCQAVVLLNAWLLPIAMAVPQGIDSTDASTTEQQKTPPAEPVYKGRRIAQTMHYDGAPWLIRESREREEECSTLLANLGVRPGDTVCDLGCGNGFYALKLAELVGEEGTVLAVDIQTEMLSFLRVRAKEAKITNIETVHSTPVDPQLPAGKVDLMLLVDVYHEFSHPEPMLEAIHRSLKPNGRVALVEFRAEDLEVPIKPLHKMSKRQIMKEFPPNDFKLVGEFHKLPWQHVMFFAREDSPLKEVKPTASNGELDAAKRPGRSERPGH